MDSFIEKMVQSLSDEMKQKRKDILEGRKEEIAAATTRQTTKSTPNSRRARRNQRRTTSTATVMANTEMNGTPRVTIVDLTVTTPMVVGSEVIVVTEELRRQ